jgi:hypothetical protein
MHRQLYVSPLIDITRGIARGWTFEQLGWNLDKNGFWKNPIDDILDTANHSHGSSVSSVSGTISPQGELFATGEPNYVTRAS